MATDMGGSIRASARSYLIRNWNSLVWAKVKTVTASLGIWAASIVVIYLFGWSIGWIIKGFAKKTG
jgi:hypothetical protein